MKRLLLIMLIIMLGMCSSCSGKDKENKSEAAIDYKEAYEEYRESFIELNQEDNLLVEEGNTPITLYYRDSKNYLVPIMRQISKRESMAKSAISALLNTPENRVEIRDTGLLPPLPQDLVYELALKEDGLMRISFNDAILSFKSQREESNAVQAITYTLTEFDTVTKVQILVNNEIIPSLTNGTKIGEPLTRTNINGLDNVLNGQYVKNTFYSYNNVSNNYTYYIPITKNILKENKNIPSIVREQMKLNTELNIKNPDGFEIDNVAVEGTTVYISLKNKIDTESEEFTRFIKAMCLTLGQSGHGVDTVKLLVGNESVENMSILSYSIPAVANVFK